jgi:glycosyltransferase involved in cell wall biosynthesis
MPIENRVAIVTSFPRAQQVEVYNEMARLNEVNFRVFYLRQMPYGRHWTSGPQLEHDHCFVRELRLRKHLYLSPGILKAYFSYNPTLTIFTQYAVPASQFLMYLATLKRQPWVFWAERPYVRFSEDPIVENKALRKYLRGLALLPIKHFPRAIWGIGETAKNEYRDLAAKSIKVSNLPYFADLTKFFEVGLKRSENAKVRFLFSGSLTLRKAADVVLAAAEKLCDEKVDFELHVIGDGPLMEKFEGLRVRNSNSLFLHGFQQIESVPEFYGNTDVLIFPSRHDGWGHTLQEGMAAGMPVISTTTTGAAIDMLAPKTNGILLDRLDRENLVAAMKVFIEDRNLVCAMGENARQTAQQYTSTLGARQFVNMIRNSLT